MSRYAMERIAHPQKHYVSADDVANDAGLTADEKRRVLDSMALNAELLSEATGEGMTGGEQPPSLQEIRKAQEKIRAMSRPSSSLGWRTILVALSGDGDLDRKVTRAGFEMAALAGGRVHIVNVIEPGATMSAPVVTPTMAAPHVPPQIDQDLLEEERARRMQFNTDIRGELEGDQAGEDQVVLGETSVEVARAAGDCGADLVVIGAMDRTWFDKLFGISPTQSVSENTTCPVLVIPAA